MNGLDFEIREADEVDVGTVVDFNCLLAAETEDKHLDRETVELGVRALLDEPTRGRYFVACRDGDVIGQIMHTFEWSDWRNGSIWWIQSVYVHTDFRRCGVFRGLYRHLEKLARDDERVVGLRLYVEQENGRAHSTYGELGMQRPGYFVMEQMFGSGSP